MNPRVSVILTLYNRTEYLTGALQSALAQTMTDFEIIVADDSGTGIAGSICESFRTTGKVRHLANPKNLGIALSLRAALAVARGEYFAILNDDDLWEPGFLATLVPPLEMHPDVVVVFGDHWIVGPDGAIDVQNTEGNTARHGRANLPEGRISNPAEFVVSQNGVPLAMAALIRKSAVDLTEIVPEVSGAYDYWISCLLAAGNGGFYYVPSRVTRYRVHPALETARRRPNGFANHVHIYSQLLERGLMPALRQDLERKLSHALLLVGRDHLYFNLLPEARSYLRRSFALAPTVRAFGGWTISFLPKAVRVWLKLSAP